MNHVSLTRISVVLNQSPVHQKYEVHGDMTFRKLHHISHKAQNLKNGITASMKTNKYVHVYGFT